MSQHRRAIRLRPTSSVLLALASLVGLVAFGWPFVMTASSHANHAHAGDAPWLFALLIPLLLVIVLAEVSEGALDAKAVSMLALLAACGAALRVPDPGVAGFEPMFFLLVLAGRAMGRGFGFVLGALTLAASGLFTGGVGPWLPFQMLCAAWMGFGAGCLPPARGRRELALLAGTPRSPASSTGADQPVVLAVRRRHGQRLLVRAGGGALANLHRFILFDLTTSLGFDLPRAVINAGLLFALGTPVLAALRRAARRASFEPIIEPLVDVERVKSR